jgi:hypothetical protein
MAFRSSEGTAFSLHHLFGAPEEASGCNPMESAEATEPLESKNESNLVQSGATGGMVGARGLEPRTSSVSRKRSDP